MYKCPRCHYETIKKNDLKCHFYRKKVCLSIYSKISQKELKEKVIEKNAFKIIESNINMKDEYNKKKYQCEYCHKYYSTNSNLNKHIKKCKEKKELDNSKDEHIKLLQQEILRLKELKQSYNKITNNYYNTHNTLNNYRQEIKINAFRKENINYLSDEYIINIAKRGMYYAVPALIKKIYFNEEHPENKNVKITNEKSKYAEIFDGSKFVKYAKNLVVRDMINIAIDVIDEICYDVEMPNSYNIFSDKYNDNDRKLMNSLFKKAEGIALTYSKNEL